ncbi:MAG: hypothetical protein ACI38Q_00035 [Candidatus Bruticola sp.]
MAETNRDILQTELAEAAEKVESRLKFVRKQLSVFRSLGVQVGGNVCRLNTDFDELAPVSFESVQQQICLKLSDMLSSFAAALSSQASALGIDCHKLNEALHSGALRAVPGQPLSLLPVGLFRLAIKGGQSGISVFLGGVLAAEGWSAEVGKVAANLVKLESELNSRRTVTQLALNRLCIAWTVLSKSSDSCTLRELWPIVHSIGLVAGNFGRRPGKNNLGCYTKAQFMYDTIKALEEVGKQSVDSRVCAECGAADLNLDSRIRILCNGGSYGC